MLRRTRLPRHLPRRTGALLAVAVLAGLSGLTAGCGGTAPSDRLTAPGLGACRLLDAAALTRPTDDTDASSCRKRHTAQTFLVGRLPASTGSSYDDKRHGTYVYRTCNPAFGPFLGADESLAMRVRLSWSWFRPSRKAWSAGARWFRCDVVGGPDGATRLAALPRTAKGMFLRARPDRWLSCARGARFAGSVKLSCAEQHDWRAVSTIKLGQAGDRYPGDRLVEVRTRDYCSDAVGAWLNYAPDYEYAYTFFHEAEWRAGNRRSICWARTDR